jgi:DNA processing protein
MSLREFYSVKNLQTQGFSLSRAFQSLEPTALTLLLKEQTKLFDQAKDAVEACEKKNFKMLYPGHEFYPQNFLNIDHPPTLLTYRGEVCWSSLNKISVVGSRDMSMDSQKWMETHFNEYLKKSRAVTVSGAAFGIDQLVHRLSVRNCLPTIAFLPSGLNHIYPQKFEYCVDSILGARGAILSEFLPHVEMRKYHFERRNRLIAGVSELLFVVEARRKSGSLITARLALNQGKNVCVLPSSPNQTQNLGNLDLLFDGAHPIRDEEDLLILSCSSI